MGYLRYYPENGVFTDEFTGKLEVMNMSRSEISTSNFSNFEYIPENKTSGISVDCFRTFKIISRNCSHGGNHKLGVSCENGLVNDAYIKVVDLTDCKTTITSDIYQMPKAIIDLNPGRGGGGYSSTVKWNQFYKDLNVIKTDWLDKDKNSDLKNEIKSFLISMNYSDESINKANAIISFLSSDNILKANNTYLAKFIQNKLLFSSTLNYTDFINFWNNLTTAEKNVFANYANENSNAFLAGISIKAESFLNWAFEFLLDNPDVSISNFENWFLSGNDMDYNLTTEYITDLKNPELILPTRRFKSNTRLNAIYNKAKQAANIKQYLQNFDAQFSVAHLVLDVKPFEANSEANARTYEPEHYRVEIIFNENKLNRPWLDIARTMMHEVIHAENVSNFTFVSIN